MEINLKLKHAFADLTITSYDIIIEETIYKEDAKHLIEKLNDIIEDLKRLNEQ